MGAPQTYEAGVEFNSLALVGIAKKAIGPAARIVVKPYERALVVRIEDEKVNLVFETFLVREMKMRTRFLKKGKRIVSYAKSGEKLGEMIVWDETPPTTAEVVNVGRTHTEPEVRDRVTFERDCYRPGSDRAPLDNYARTQAGPTAPKMERHW